MQSVRLNKIVSLIPQCKDLADVGCDHGYVGIEALRLALAERVVFVDVSRPSLDKAQSNCPKEYLSAVSFVCQDGLQGLTVDCAVIAGMGGLEIISILQCAHTLPSMLVLQPMRNQREVRSFLLQNYEILTDEKFCDGKYYDIIVAKRAGKSMQLTQMQLEYGKTNLENPSLDFISYLNKELTKIRNYPIFANDSNLQAKAEEMEHMIAEYLAKRH